MPRNKDAEDRRDRRQGDRGVARLRLPECLDTVRDGLDTAQSNRARGERAQQQERRRAREHRLPAREVIQRRMIHLELTKVTERDADQAPPDQQGHHHDVEVRRRREQAAGLPHAAQVRHHDQSEQRERQRDLMAAQRRDRRRDRRDAGRDRHRHRQRVVDHQRGRRDQRRSRPEVLAAHDVRAAAARIRVQGLAVARGHDRQQCDDDQRDRHEIVERRHPRRPAPGRPGSPATQTPSTRWHRSRTRPARPACSNAAPPAPPMPAATRSGAASTPNTRREPRTRPERLRGPPVRRAAERVGLRIRWRRYAELFEYDAGPFNRFVNMRS